MKFKELEECPFCGHDTFYTVQYVYGSLHYRERFDGEESENGEMYDINEINAVLYELDQSLIGNSVK